MSARQERRWILRVLLLSAVVGMLVALWSGAVKDAGTERNPASPMEAVAREIPPRERPRRLLTAQRWEREMEGVLGAYEAGRSRILMKKETVDSEIHLLGVEPPTQGEIEDVRKILEDSLSRLETGARAEAEEKLGEMMRNYDPFGGEGRRVIVIDVPDEPNGRLSGFTCSAPDIQDMIRRFDEGRMTELQNVRGYHAHYAGMPLERFRKFITMDDE